ncbi:MAG: phosphomethylpyrimidine synthase ThiC, partial [Armatimonadetes bacterium]|nr:phosphomethylpyrimidine synthase ThiC [Armatimonadota bacterium]
MTQLERARSGELSPQMQSAAEHDGVEPELLQQGIAEGTIVLPANRNHRSLRPVAIGKGLRIKVNANLGTSAADADPAQTVARARSAIDAGADTVMDLSTA